MTRKLGYLVLIVSFSIFSFRTTCWVIVLQFFVGVTYWPNLWIEFPKLFWNSIAISLFFSVLANHFPNPFYSVCCYKLFYWTGFLYGDLGHKGFTIFINNRIPFRRLATFHRSIHSWAASLSIVSIVRFSPLLFLCFCLSFSLGNHSPLITRAIQYLAILLLFVWSGLSVLSLLPLAF